MLHRSSRALHHARGAAPTRSLLVVLQGSGLFGSGMDKRHSDVSGSIP